MSNFVGLIATNNNKSSGTSIACTVPVAGVPVGALVIVALARDNIATTEEDGTCADTQSNTYTLDSKAGAVGNANLAACRIFSSKITTALVSGNTITCSWTTARTAKVIVAIQVSNPVTTPFDKQASANGSSTTPASGATATTSQNDEFIFGAIAVEDNSGGAFTPGTGWTNVPGATYVGTTGSGFASNMSICCMYKDQTVAATHNSDGTISSGFDWASCCATYKTSRSRMHVT